MAGPTQRRATQYPALLMRKPRTIPVGIGSNLLSLLLLVLVDAASAVEAFLPIAQIHALDANLAAA